MIRLVNIGEKETSRKWGVKEEPFCALWTNIDEKDMFIACTEKALKDVKEIKDNTINNCILIRNKKGSLIVENNPKEQWSDSLIISVNVPEGCKIECVNFAKSHSNLIDVLYYKMSKDNSHLLMVINVPSIIGRLAMSKDIMYNIIEIQYIKDEIINSICINSTDGLVTYDDKERILLENRLQPVQSINRKPVLVVPDNMTMENIVKCKNYNRLYAFKTVKYAEVEEYFKTSELTYFDIYMVKNLTDESNYLRTLETVLKQNKKNARICERKSNKAIELSRIY